MDVNPCMVLFCFFWFCFKSEYSKNEPYTDWIEDEIVVVVFETGARVLLRAYCVVVQRVNAPTQLDESMSMQVNGAFPLRHNYQTILHGNWFNTNLQLRCVRKVRWQNSGYGCVLNLNVHYLA